MAKDKKSPARTSSKTTTKPSMKTNGKASKAVVGSIGTLGDYLKEQRLSAQLSLRQLADQVGVSNPYLSQIERGLRKPSAEILQQIAKALQISAESLYVRAGILDPDQDVVVSVVDAVHRDPYLSPEQKQTLLRVYESLRAQAAAGGSAAERPSA